MKFALTIFMSFCFAGIAFCQNRNSQAPPPLSSEEIIRQMIELHSDEGQMRKHVAVMGDAAAVAVTRILAGKNPSAADTDMVLLVLNSAFTDPSAVAVVTDREPRTAFFVLQYLEFCASRPELKARIAESRGLIQQRYAKYLRESSGKAQL